MEKFALPIKYSSLQKSVQSGAFLWIALWKCGEVKIDALSLFNLTALGLTISKHLLKQQIEL